MTSRVQKGGSIFRPVAQPRPHPPSATSRIQPQDAQQTSHLSAPFFEPQSYEPLTQVVHPTNISVQADAIRNTPAPPVLVVQRTATLVQPIPPTPISVSFRPPTSGSRPLDTPALEYIRAVNLVDDVQLPPSELNASGLRAEESTEQSATIEKSRSMRKPHTVSHRDAQAEPETAQKPKRSRKASFARRSRGPSLPPYDPGADPGEELDPTIVTMATLCDDTGKGRVSSKATEILSNHATWKTRNKEKRARMRTFMELKKYGREREAENEKQGATSGEADAPTTVAAATEGRGGDNEGGFDYTQGLAAGRFNIRVRVGPNGETIVDEESLVVDRTEVENTQDYTHIVESDTSKFINSATYSKRFRGSRWSAEETERFYDALSQYGENYELIAYVLPGRDRKSCKNKFKVEDKKNPARINYCLNNRVPVDMQTLSRMTGKDFSGPVPEIRAPTPRPAVRVEDSGTSADNPNETTSAREAAEKKVKRSRGRNVAAEDGVIIVGHVETDHHS